MLKRMILALGTGLISVGSTFAQAPVSVPPMPAPLPAEHAVMQGTGASVDSIPNDNYWVTADFLLGLLRGDNVQPLVTTSRAGTPQTSAGILYSPNSGTLNGGNIVNDDIRSGVRFGAGGWLTADHVYSIEAGFSALESQSSVFSASSNGSPILARPYIDANTGLRQAQIVAFPGISNGAIDTRVSSGNFYETHIDIAESLVHNEHWRTRYSVGLPVLQLQRRSAHPPKRHADRRQLRGGNADQ